jgi:hypothetical protein
LANHHTQLNYLRVFKLRVHALEKSIINRMVVSRHLFGVLDRQLFPSSKVIGLRIQLGNFIFSEIFFFFCTRQKSCV